MVIQDHGHQIGVDGNFARASGVEELLDIAEVGSAVIADDRHSRVNGRSKTRSDTRFAGGGARFGKGFVMEQSQARHSGEQEAGFKPAMPIHGHGDEEENGGDKQWCFHNRDQGSMFRRLAIRRRVGSWRKRGGWRQRQGTGRERGSATGAPDVRE
jgi:hypothetical protein